MSNFQALEEAGLDDGGVSTTLSADGQNNIALPGTGFTADAQMTRDGADLILRSPDGETLVIEGYFTADPAPVLTGEDGFSLTPDMVNAFARAPAQFAAADTATDESPVGTAEEVQGNVTVTRADGTSETVTPGTPIYQGDIVETDAGGAVNLVFTDETSMAISKNARFAVDEYAFDPATESGVTNFSVLRGVFVFTSGLIGRDDPDDVTIDTPVGSIGIRGTTIAGNIDPNGESEISLIDGAIVVKNGTMEMTLSQQFETITLTGFNAPMQNIGVLSANDFTIKFASLNGVAPSLFSTIGDAGKDQAVDPAADKPVQADTAPVENDNSQETLPEADLPASQDPALNLPDLLDSKPPGNEGMQERPTLDREGMIKTIIETKQDMATNRGIVEVPQFTGPNNSNNTSGNTVSGPPQPLDLNNATANNGVSKIGDTVANRAGYSISAGSDFNNDGYSDFVFTNNTNATGQNHSYVAYGNANGAPSGNIAALVLSGGIELGNLPDDLENNSLAVTASIGDFDGDGVNDYIVGQQTSSGGATNSGNAYIVSGADDSNFLDLTNVNSLGKAGASVSGIGDLNNDGYADVIVGAPGEGGTTQGSAFVLFGGSPYGTALDVTNLGTSGMRLNGAVNADMFGKSDAGIGDFNGDGTSDFAVGAPGSGTGDPGRVSIYHNGDATADISITGGGSGHMLGYDIFGAGDFNGDGRSDILIGANGTNPNTTPARDEAYIIFGGASTNLNVNSLGTAGIKFSLPATGSAEIFGGGAAGDFNGDGFDDVALAVRDGSTLNVYVVYGTDSPMNMSAEALNDSTKAFKMVYTGLDEVDPDISIAGVGDVDGDGYDDLAIGLPDENSGTGTILVIEGRDQNGVTTRTTATENGAAVVGRASADMLSDGGFTAVSLRGGAGNDTFSIANNDFRKLDGGTGNDTLQFGTASGDLDFSDMNFEAMSGIENLVFGEASQTMVLKAENIFNLLKSSDDGTLTIAYGSGITDGILTINALTPASGSFGDKIVDALNEFGAGATYDGQSGGMETFSIGGYTLLIATDVAANATVV